MDTQNISEKARTTKMLPEFFPRGAIAFFVCMLVGFAAIWLAMYALLVHRQFHI